MKKLLICLLAMPFGAYAAELVLGLPSANDNPGWGNGQNALNLNASGQITQTLQAHEDQTNSVGRFEQQFSYCAGIVADGQCGNPARFLHTVTCASDDPSATAGSMAIRDATAAGAGTIIQNVNFAAAYFAPVTMIFDIALTTGLYLDFTTTADVECSASYR